MFGHGSLLAVEPLQLAVTFSCFNKDAQLIGKHGDNWTNIHFDENRPQFNFAAYTSRIPVEMANLKAKHRFF